jgi:hypothetical protein
MKRDFLVCTIISHLGYDMEHNVVPKLMLMVPRKKDIKKDLKDFSIMYGFLGSLLSIPGSI